MMLVNVNDDSKIRLEGNQINALGVVCRDINDIRFLGSGIKTAIENTYVTFLIRV